MVVFGREFRSSMRLRTTRHLRPVGILNSFVSGLRSIYDGSSRSQGCRSRIGVNAELVHLGCVLPNAVSIMSRSRSSHRKPLQSKLLERTLLVNMIPECFRRCWSDTLSISVLIRTCETKQSQMQREHAVLPVELDIKFLELWSSLALNFHTNRLEPTTILF